ncbi:hypothetical protein [Chloroflexus sp.]|nr:hypothetical protein [Chloroflexus sp.]
MLPFIPDPAPIHWNAAGESGRLRQPVVCGLLSHRRSLR